MFETTVKKFFPDHGYGFLVNPDPTGKDIYFRAQQRLTPGKSKVRVLATEVGPLGPRAAKWREIKPKPQH